MTEAVYRSWDELVQPHSSGQFHGLSQPMVGHFIPGLLRRYPVKKVNYPDMTITVKQVKLVQPITKFPDMGEPHGKEHPVMKQLHKLLGQRGPQIQPGYERVREDLSWRRHGRQSAPDMFGVDI